MKTVKKVSFMAALAFSAAFAFSEKIILTPQSSVDFAMKNNFSLKQEKISLGGKKRAGSYSWNGISPSASLSASYSKTVPSEENRRDSVSAGIRISAGLTPSLYSQVKNAALAYQAQEITYEAAKSSISLSVVKSYYSILYEIENLSLSRKNLETKKNQYKSNLEKFNRGVLNQVDVLSAEINYKDTELNVESQKISLENSIALFKQALGLNQNDEVEFSGDFSIALSLDKIDGTKIQMKSSSVDLLEKQLLSARTSLLESRFKAYGPSLSASYSYSKNYDADSLKENSKGGSLSVGASIPLDGIMPWSSSSLSVDSAKENVESLRLKLEDEKISVEIKKDSLVKKINQCVDNIAVRRESIGLAEKNYDMTLKAYNYGTRDLLTLQSAQDSLLQSKVKLIEEANSLVASLCELKNLGAINLKDLIGAADEKNE